MKKTYSIQLSESTKLAQALVPELTGGEILALIGPLGAGKTTFTKALGKALKIRKNIGSPTFIIMNRYKARISSGKQIFLYHLDLYRTHTFSEAEQLGLKEFWGKPDTVTVIEWADKIKKHLPKKTTIIKFRH